MEEKFFLCKKLTTYLKLHLVFKWAISEKMNIIIETTVAIKKTRHLVNLPYKPGISN